MFEQLTKRQKLPSLGSYRSLSPLARREMRNGLFFLSPWIVGLWVAPSQRRRGIGAELLKGACDHARRTGTAALYASTNTASALFAREGWLKFDIGRTDGGDAVEIFRIALT